MLGLLLISILCCCSPSTGSLSDSSSPDSALRFVHVVWRHGDRSPLFFMPTDVENQQKSWPEGRGGLTEIGMNQHYDLGRYLRKRYIESTNFLSSKYDPGEIYVRSSNMNRTITSARANMVGFYSLSTRRSVAKAVERGEPVEIDVSEDAFIEIEKARCPEATRAREESLRKSDDVRRMTVENLDFLRRLTDLSGCSLNSPLNISCVYEPLLCESIHKRKWPKWVTPDLFRKVSNLYDWSWSVWYDHPMTRRLRGGPLFREIALRFETKALSLRTEGRMMIGTFPETLKYFVYSGHDNTLISLLSHLGAYEGLGPPPFASALILEMHEDLRTDFFYIKAFYINGTGAAIQPHPINMKSCGGGGFECELEEFVNLALSNSPDPSHWRTECGLGEKKKIH